MLFGKKKGTDFWVFGLDEKDYETFKDITDEIHSDIITRANEEQKRITADKDGNPILENIIVSKEEEKTNRLLELQGYLESTDWYVIRQLDEGTPIPDDIKKKRIEVREEISKLRGELK